MATSTPPSKAATTSSLKVSRIIFVMTFDECGVTSLGFVMTQLPAAIIGINGVNKRVNGTFQAPNNKHTPRGSYLTRYSAPGATEDGWYFSFIQSSRCSTVKLISSKIISTSDGKTPVLDGLPRSK